MATTLCTFFCLQLRSLFPFQGHDISYYLFADVPGINVIVMINHIYNNDTWNIRKQVVGYSISLKRKRGAKLMAKGYTEGRYHRMFNNMLDSSSNLLQTNIHKCCSVLKAMDYNYKLRSVIGREDNCSVTKWTWFDKQVRDTFLCSWMIS